VTVNDSVLVIDDNREYCEALCSELRRRGYAGRAAYSGAAGLASVMEAPPRLIILDLNLVDMSGMDVLTQVRQVAPAAEVVIATAFPELSSALGAIKQKAIDYLCKPFSFDELDTILRRVLTRGVDGPKPAAAKASAASSSAAIPEMVGDSAATQDMKSLIGRIAETGVRAALITGESGTGKDLAARLFHARSRRRSGPFIEVNCSAITETLFESELFGHEKGAFTGAVSARRGLVEMADGGTLFLDEVAEIPLVSQPKLLRFLEDQSFIRVGGTRKTSVDVQIIAATNRDLRAMVEQWTFRADLYFRLNVVPIVLPPLRERLEDIVPLLRFWLAEANTRYGKKVEGFTEDAEAALLRHPWPGNARELRNLVERLVILARGTRITRSDLPGEYLALPMAPAAAGAQVAPEGDSLEHFERQHIRKVLARVDGNKTRAAEILGISRHTLRIKLTS
jgi:DNA-binding NtrC family response regulator